uniref:Leucine-rich repeat and WD repeat-containing protein KIAA1239-like n=1 Tax=Saccoglossus kowalevskii TaxID=10224 RepID=A0ABM0H122_SACKO|nr:PREDICTED: leucine-rich repeat and WD repeat-containing protein KIAA1239-like [Saccoglossus kowalevskii]
MATKDAELLLFGKVGDTLPPLRSRVVRIFTSSTFTDTSVERNALMSEIYPKIKDYCKTNYGLEFQVVDMRWGVRDEATDDHMTSQLCMNEIKACQKLSTGPNFVTFLCQKYGYRPFPPKIPADEFEAMRDVLNGDGKSVDILNDWFQKDANAVPPIYILQPISSKLIHFNDNDHPDKMTEDRNKWWEIFETLQAQLRDAAATCLKNGKFNAQQEAKYKISVTHDEVVHGILGQNTDKKEDHCVCFVRKFQDLESKSDNKEAKNFIDINWEDGKVDEEAKQLLTQLRDEQVPASLNKTNVVISSLNNWSEKGVDLDIPEHKQYLEKFLKTFYETIVELIERAVEKDKSHISNHPMYEEILQHLEFCKVKCQSFHGRGDLLLNIKNYIQERISGNSQNASPMIVYGESGSGKTSLVAKAAFQSATEWFGQGKSAVILRFLGTTPASTGVRQLIKSVCQQILTIYGHGDTKLPDDYFQVVRWFSKVLRYATHDKPLVIFLDSLDQLSAAEGAHRMAWLPKYLPPHVAILVSTLPKEHGILNTLQNILPSMEGAVEVKQLSVEESMHIIQSWLQSEKRTTNSEQQGIISTAIQQCSLPLFLKLLFDQASSWQSYLPSSKINVQPSVKGMIAVIFDRLEEYHGKALVSHALSYMTISQNGIGEAELEDLLSLDDEVLQDVYAYWLPPTRRIPPLLWTRIRADINDYLVEREAEGSRVIFWYHRQFIEAAAERYLHDAEFVKRLHIMCAQYFLGNWSGGKKKPFHYTSEQMNKFNKTRKEDEEDRKVAPQPYIFQAGSGATQYNVRKLEQLPYHLIHSNDVKKLKEHTLCNYEFILNKLMGMNLAEVLQDFTMAIAKYEDDDDIQMVSDTIRVGSSALRENPYHLIFEIIGRLKDSKSPHLIKLVSDAEKATTDQLALVPYNQCYPAPGGLLRTQLIGHTDEVLAVATTFDGRYLISGSRDTTAIVWELESSSIHHTLKGQHKSPISDLVITPDDLMVITYCYTTEQEDDRSTEINVWNIETGEHFLKLEGHSSQGTRPIRYTPDSKFAVSDMYDERVEGCTYVREYYFIVWSLENGRPLYQRVEAHKDTINDIAVARSQQGRYLVVTCGHDEDPGIKIWDLLSGQHLTEIIDRSKLQHTACNAMGVSSNGRYVGFHFHRHAILDVYTDEFMYLTKEDCSSAQEVKFLYNDTEIFFKDYRSDYYYQYNVEAKTISRSGWFSGRVGGYMEKLFFTEDWKIIVSKNENADAGEVWKASKEKIGDGNDPCQHLCRLPHTKQVNDMCFVNIPQSTLAITGSSDNSIKVWNLDYLRRMQKKSEVKKGEGDDDDEDDDDEDDDSDHDDDANETYAERSLISDVLFIV